MIPENGGLLKARVLQKLEVLADAAKYDVSCSSSGSSRQAGQGLGNAVRAGVCHSFTEDGRCISLLKILMTNHCIYDCAYCVNRRSNDVPRASFSVEELVALCLNFYRRNYIEGLFLSSGVITSPDYTMERLLAVARSLRQDHGFNAYIHLKAIPGSSHELVAEAGLWADRISVNIEIPSEQGLKLLAPEKNYPGVFAPMNQIQRGILQAREERKRYRSAPRFAPAGQSTQLVIGASPESDFHILRLAGGLYEQQQLKRVYYSGFIPVNAYDARLPALSSPPLLRENRLYQADWLMRFYKFRFDEILDESLPMLDSRLDPKLAWALRHPEFFPVDLDTAPYEDILRVPGIGIRSARLITGNRIYTRIRIEHLKKMGVALNRAKYFIRIAELPAFNANIYPEQIRRRLLSKTPNGNSSQLSLFSAGEPSVQT